MITSNHRLYRLRNRDGTRSTAPFDVVPTFLSRPCCTISHLLGAIFDEEEGVSRVVFRSHRASGSKCWFKLCL